MVYNLIKKIQLIFLLIRILIRKLYYDHMIYINFWSLESILKFYEYIKNI